MKLTERDYCTQEEFDDPRLHTIGVCSECLYCFAYPKSFKPEDVHLCHLCDEEKEEEND